MVTRGSTGLLTLALAASSASAATVFNDDFLVQPSGGGWTATLAGDAIAQPWAQGTAYETAAAMLKIYSVPDPASNNGIWGTAYLTHSFAPVAGDFSASARLIYDQSGANPPMQSVGIQLLDGSNTVVASAMWVDAWVSASGSRSGAIGASTGSSAFGSAPYADDVVLTISRTGGFGTVQYASTADATTYTLLNGVALPETISSVRIVAEYYNYPTSTFTPASIDYVSITAVPEPASLGLLAGLVPLLLRRKRIAAEEG